MSKKLEPMDPKWWDFVMSINANGTFYGSSWCAASMAKLPAAENGMRGVIINVASVAGIEGQKGQVPYSASKVTPYLLLSSTVTAQEHVSCYCRGLSLE